MVSSSVADNSVASTAGISGIVHGGRQPISGAVVKLWAAGNAGYGSAATVLQSTTTDTNGNFSFGPGSGNTYSCPSLSSATESQYIYITTLGGQPTTGVANPNAALMVALGNCSSVLSANPAVDVDEVTTVASMFALQQFFSPSGSGLGNFGTSPTNINGLANAMATVNNLVNIASGTANLSTTATGTVALGYSPVVTITPEQSKINSLANILAACVNSPGTGTPCSTLFSGVNSTAALDTLQAAYYLATNPTSTVSSTSNITAIYNTAVANSPFNPSLTAVPTDWSIGVTYGSASVNTGGTYFINDPTYLAVDGSGNVWALNDASSTTASYNSLTELNPVGIPVAQAFTGSGLIGPSWLAIDPSGNAWISNYGSASALQTSAVEYTTGGATNTFTTNKGPQRMAIDGKGDVFVIEPSYKGLGDLEEIPAGSASGTTATTLASSLTTDYSNIAIDGNYTVWVTGGGTGSLGGTSGYPYVYQFLYSSTSPNYPSTPSATTNAGGIAEPEQAISIDSNNYVWVENYGAEKVSCIWGTSTISALTVPYAVQANLTKPEFQVTDGAGNLWVADAATTVASPAGSVYEISNAGVSIAPAVGFAHTYNEPYGIAIDPSGNVWVAAYAGAEPNGFITEIVGQAVPVVTPIAAGLPTTPGGTNRLGTRP
jgi:hypothetical protein